MDFSLTHLYIIENLGRYICFEFWICRERKKGKCLEFITAVFWIVIIQIKLSLFVQSYNELYEFVSQVLLSARQQPVLFQSILFACRLPLETPSFHLSPVHQLQLVEPEGREKRSMDKTVKQRDFYWLGQKFQNLFSSVPQNRHQWQSSQVQIVLVYQLINALISQIKQLHPQKISYVVEFIRIYWYFL